MGNKCFSGEDVQQVQEHTTLTVYVKNARGLPGVDCFLGTDRFFHFGVGADAGGEELFKSQRKKNVMDPVWNEEFQLPANMSLKFTIFQSDEDGKAYVVAGATLDLVSLDTAEFHGELPLEVDAKPTGAVLMLKAKSGDEYPPEQSSEFIASIDNPKRKDLGIEVDSTDPAKLFVIGVKKGTAVDRYNEEQIIENKIAAGCFIVGATGAGAGSASESEAMKKLLKQNPKQVDIVCRRATKFRIPVTLPAKGDIGVEVLKRPLGNSLLITKITGNGGVNAWNADHPEQLVEPWDRIVAVDGKAGKAADLSKLMKAAKKTANVVLTVARIASEVSEEQPVAVAEWV